MASAASRCLINRSDSLGAAEDLRVVGSIPTLVTIKPSLGSIAEVGHRALLRDRARLSW